jgi:hypothetical protein
MAMVGSVDKVLGCGGEQLRTLSSKGRCRGKHDDLKITPPPMT